jgi:hypothetical protein
MKLTIGDCLISAVSYNAGIISTHIQIPAMNRILSALPVILFILLSPFTLLAQSQSGDYLKVTYLQVEKNHLSEFLDGIDEWKEHHQAKMNEDEQYKAWRLYQVPYSSSGQWYNFVSVGIASNLNTFQTEERMDVRTLREGQGHQLKLNHAVHSEIWKTETGVFSDATEPSRYLNANFMFAYPESLQDYLHLETEIAEPLHQNQAENNRMDGWNFYRLVFPTGSMVAYNFITADHYSNLEQIEMGITREVIMDVHPDLNVDEFEDFADSIRERVWSDLWELVEYAD